MADELTLADRLRTAIDETERIAQAALAGPWRYNPAKQWHAPADLAERRNGEEYVAAGPHHAPVCVAVTGPAENEQSMADARHIAHHDPLRVLRRCAADRKILDLHAPGVTLTSVTDGGTVTTCMSCGGWYTMKTGTEWPCDTIKALAEAYGVED